MTYRIQSKFYGTQREWEPAAERIGVRDHEEIAVAWMYIFAKAQRTPAKFRVLRIDFGDDVPVKVVAETTTDTQWRATSSPR